MQQTGPHIQQIKLVKHQWSQLRLVKAQILGDVFYGKLFFDFPKTRRPFDRLMASQRIDDSNEALKELLAAIISRLDKPEELSIRLNSLSIQLRAAGLDRKSFQQLATCLIWTLRQAFGTDWSSDAELAWTACILLIEARIFEH